MLHCLKHKCMEEKKYFKVITEESVILLLNKANSLNLKKEDVISIVENDGSYYMFYYK